MDPELFALQFEGIEKKVEKLIAVSRSFEAANVELRNRIAKLEEEVQAKAEAEKRYMEERAQVRSKIDGLLARLEEASKGAIDPPAR